MFGATPWYASKTILAGIIGVIVPVIGMVLHVSVTDAQVDSIATDLSLIGGALAGLAAIYGRVKATQPIKGTQAAAVIAPMSKGP